MDSKGHELCILYFSIYADLGIYLHNQLSHIIVRLTGK